MFKCLNNLQTHQTSGSFDSFGWLNDFNMLHEKFNTLGGKIPSITL